MDGFAVRVDDTAQASRGRPVTLQVRQHIAAGTAEVRHVAPGEAARIMTGAPLPPDADGVVPIEDVQAEDGSVTIFAPVAPGACVRPAGNDMQAGEDVLAAGTILQPPHIALLASLGMGAVPATRRPTVGVLSTGDELVAPGGALGPGQIYNSNTPMLSAAIAEAGGIARPLHAAVDDPGLIQESLDRLRSTDLIVTSGGASVGDHDYMKQILNTAGSVDFWQVRVRPGKPLLFGSIGSTHVVGLPGNPTSAMVTFELFVRPAIRAMLGAPLRRPEIKALLDDRLDNQGGRRTYARVRLHFRGGRYHATLAGRQDSAMLLPLARADGLLVAPEDREVLLPGEEATVQVWHLPA
jgi:molybdopterin molybdotransferase